MKNQYFGDKNDFFKYDLVLTLIEQIEDINTFTFIPMLTKRDQSGNGCLTEYNGSRRKDLASFLRKCVVNNKRSIKNLRIYMANYSSIRYLPYRDDQYFNIDSREEYFNSINREYLSKAVILVDPDNGFEVNSIDNKNGHKYLKFIELKRLYNSMDQNSILIVYQHIPRVQRHEYFNSLNEKIQNTLIQPNLICISDNVISFFIISKTQNINQKVWDIVKEYSIKNKYITYKYFDEQGFLDNLERSKNNVKSEGLNLTEEINDIKNTKNTVHTESQDNAEGHFLINFFTKIFNIFRNL